METEVSIGFEQQHALSTSFEAIKLCAMKRNLYKTLQRVRKTHRPLKFTLFVWDAHPSPRFYHR